MLNQTFTYDNLGNLTVRTEAFTTPRAATINESNTYDVLVRACARRTLAVPWDNLSMPLDCEESISLGYARKIAEHVGVHYSTLSRAVRGLVGEAFNEI